ncbi:diguanylate cyclase [Vibrio sp. T187]|uniref:sensor domain-containing diguanylate cyclase n=1 Tax=Vibrio TaxID=662 RepID=UPI0010C9D1AE|nr:MULTISPECIES: diguanylate cyclase [Vibrio]MBW3696273.1 diguanylate cyclase [Vibrio sp. T187]
MQSPLRHLSLKNKLLLPILLFIGLTFFATQFLNYTVTYEREKQNLVQRVKVLAKGVAYNLQAAILFDDSDSANEILSAFSADKDIVRVKLYDLEQQLFAIYRQEGVNPPVPNQVEREAILDKKFAIASEHIFLLVPVTLEGENIAYLRVTISTKSFKNILFTIIKNGAIYLGLLVVLGSLLYKLVQRFIIEPVFSLNEAMQAFVERRGKVPTLAARSHDEIGDLVNAFNTMLQRLEQREKQVFFTLDKLEQEKSFANEVVETVQHALVVTDDKGNIIHANAATREIFHCTAAYLEGLKIRVLLNSTENPQIQSALESKVDLNDHLLETQNVFGNKQQLQISTRGLSKQGQTLFAIQDVTEIEAAMSRQKLAAGVFENSKDGLIVLNSKSRITMVNPAVSQLLGFDIDELVGKTPFEVFEWRQFASLMPTIVESIKNYGQWQGEVWEQHKAGHLIPMFVKVNRIATDEHKHKFDMVLILSDLSNVKEMERLEHMAHHDALTGLANRAQLYRFLDEVLSSSHYSSSPFAVIYLDLDGFKAVNDTYGHDAGDEVLKQVSSRLLNQVRVGDLVARLSGDEFVLVIQPADKNMISALAARLLDSIQKTITYRDRELYVGASIGINFVADSARDLDTILQEADEAMYQAKKQGKGQFVFFRHANKFENNHPETV